VSGAQIGVLLEQESVPFGSGSVVYGGPLCKRHVVRQVAITGGSCFGGHTQAFAGILAHRLQHVVSPACRALLERYQRLIDQSLQQLRDLLRVDAAEGTYLLCGAQRPAAGEHREP
jgi:hypothetical protein